MRGDLRVLRDPLIAGLVWSLVALGNTALRDHLGAVMLMWMPSAVSLAAFYAVRQAHWFILSLVLLPMQAVTVWFTGTHYLVACAYSIASIVQSIIVAKLSVIALGGRRNIPTRFRHLAGAFAAAIAGCLAGAMVAIPFRAEQTMAEFGWWFMANVLAIIAGTPILLMLLRHWTGRGTKVRQIVFERSLVTLLLACALLALVALQVSEITLMPLLVAGMVVAAVRFGQMASLLVVLAYAAIATGLSLVAGSPMPFLEVPRDEAVLVMQSWMLTMLVAALPIAAMVLKRQELQHKLLASNRQMRESLALFDLAEEAANIGRWRLDVVTGKQDWSPKMLEMNGLPRSLAPDPGNVRHRLPDRGEMVFSAIARNHDNPEAYSVTYSVRPTSQLQRILRMSMLNEFDRRGERIAVFGVAMDVTEQVRREEALEVARGRAMRLATEAQKLANTDPLTDLPNRRCTFSKLDAMILVAENCGNPLSAIIFDIDHFKAVNDTYGHQIGDEVIQKVGQIAREQGRKGDVVGRIGGEEFVWLIAGSPEITVSQLAERLRANVEQGFRDSHLPKVTISAGIAYFRRGDSCETLLARADAGLYAAKGAGRNQVKRAA